MSFIKLGFWQLDRKDEKITLIMKKAELSESEGIQPSDITSATESGTPVVLKGAFDKKAILLLDNKILDGVVGFEVLQLFRDQSGLNFLVNRGFVPAGRTRSENPEIPKIEDFLGAFEGYVYRQTTNPYAIEAEKVDYNFPQIVQTPGTFDLSYDPFLHQFLNLLNGSAPLPNRLPVQFPSFQEQEYQPLRRLLRPITFPLKSRAT